MKKDKTAIQDEIRPEYDLRKLQVRKFGPARKQFGNFVKLDPDVAVVFTDAAAVNEALRNLIQTPKKNGNTRSCHLPMKILDPASKQLETSIVKLDPDVAVVFTDAAAVNEALRNLIQTPKKNRGVPSRTGHET